MQEKNDLLIAVLGNTIRGYQGSEIFLSNFVRKSCGVPVSHGPAHG